MNSMQEISGYLIQHSFNMFSKSYENDRNQINGFNKILIFHAIIAKGIYCRYFQFLKGTNFASLNAIACQENELMKFTNIPGPISM